MYQVTASIVIYEAEKEELLDTISSFLNTDMSVRLLLIDNSPTKDAQEFIPKDDRIEYHYMDGKNLGFGKAHNYAMQLMEGKSNYHLVLNPDVRFAGGVIEALTAFMDENPAVGIASPTVYDSEGNEADSCRQLPSPLTLVKRRLSFKSANEMFSSQSKASPYSSPWLSGCFMFVRATMLGKVGLFDERYFMYCEDVDFSRRMHRAGSDVVCLPSVKICHLAHRDSSHSLRMLRIHLLSAFRYFNKWGWIFDKERDAINESCTKKYLQDGNTTKN